MFTKGKWKVTQWNEGHGFNVFSDNGFVASVPMDTGLKHTMRECQANAQLIASAPALYEALLTALGLIVTLDNGKGYVTEIKEVIQNALAKAGK